MGKRRVLSNSVRSRQKQIKKSLTGSHNYNN